MLCSVGGTVLGHPQRFFVGNVGHHRGRRFGIRRELEDHLDAIDHDFLDGLGDQPGRRNESDRTGRDALAETLPDIAIRVAGQQGAVLIKESPVHGISGKDVLRDQCLHEAVGGDDLDLAGAHIRFIDDAAHAAPVVGMVMRIDHGGDGKSLANVLLEQLQTRAGRFGGHQGIKHNPARLAPDKGRSGRDRNRGPDRSPARPRKARSCCSVDRCDAATG